MGKSYAFKAVIRRPRDEGRLINTGRTSWGFNCLTSANTLSLYTLRFDGKAFSTSTHSANYHGADRLLRQMVDLYGDRPAALRGRSVTAILKSQLTPEDKAECLRLSILGRGA